MGTAAYDYWYIELPVRGHPRAKHETIEEHANRELAELTEQGWEVVNAVRTSAISTIGFMLRQAKGRS